MGVVQGRESRKECRPYLPGADKAGIGNARRVLFNLPAVLEADRLRRTIYVVEGENKVEAMKHHGLTATCNPFGAEKWRPEHAEALRGALVAVLPDNDDAGIAAAGPRSGPRSPSNDSP